VIANDASGNHRGPEVLTGIKAPAIRRAAWPQSRHVGTPRAHRGESDGLDLTQVAPRTRA
jgi:hypothetical protein